MTVNDSVTTRQKRLDNAIKRAREKGIVLPTFAQMRNPSLIPAHITEKLKNIALSELHPFNLFRISWKNEPVEKGGGFGTVNHLVIPPELSGVKASIVTLIGKWFPTGAHKVGAAYGCLAPRIVNGEFDPTLQKAVWPSTGNFCRGGAFDSQLMGCHAIAILPEEMSRERFAWLEKIGAEVIATKGCESNVKEIYDACWDIRKNRPDCVIFNQFEEWGNACWHYGVTGPAMEEVFDSLAIADKHFAGFISATGSAGTIAAGDYLRTKFPRLKVVASEALQCPTLLLNGFGAHRIEGIGDKHVPFIHNSRNTDVVTAIDDEHCLRLSRLFNEPIGRRFLGNIGIPAELIDRLDLLGISGIANLLSTIKTARYFELGPEDVLFSVATDSMALYGSRLEELRISEGNYSEIQAARDYDRCILGQSTDNMAELNYLQRKAIHNLKYFTWVEQQGKTVEELNQLWFDRHFYDRTFAKIDRWDEQIEEFNERVR